MSRIISASLSPNTEFGDVWLAFRLLLSPWKWHRGPAPGRVESWFRNYFGVGCAVSFNSGRSAFLALLKAFDIGRGDEVIVQAFTCVAVPNSALWAGATPIYADIDGSYNIDPKDFEKKITPRTKAVVVQHTFGLPANLDAIMPIVRKHKLFLIEDCAHALGATYKGKKIGKFGDAAFFSFGRDKIISSVFGGLAIIRPEYTKQIANLKAYHKNVTIPSSVWIFQQLLHPVAFAFILPLYRMGIGKALLVALQRMRFLSFPVYSQERQGTRPADFPATYPNALAVLLLQQLKKLRRYNEMRQEIVRFYGGEGSWLRYPMRVNNPKIIIEKAKKKGILLGNWYHNVIDPICVDFKKIGYIPGSCPRAEEIAKHIINLPTRISMEEAKKVMDIL